MAQNDERFECTTLAPYNSNGIGNNTLSCMSSGFCPTWKGSCPNGWIKSHGSPQIKESGDPKVGNYFYFWNINKDNGEGIFKSFAFSAGTTYSISLILSALETNGKILVYAARGLTEGAESCGAAIPGNIQKQLIYEYLPAADDNGKWKTVNPGFTANDNYSQIWIYAESNDNIQFNAGVAYVEVCKDKCSQVLVYNSGVVPTGEKKSGTITAGTNGNSGTVTIASNQNTTLIAYNSIFLKPNFQAVPGTGVFQLKMEACPEFRSGQNDIYIPTFKIEPTHENNTSARMQFSNSVDKQKSVVANDLNDNWTTYYSNGKIFFNRSNKTFPQGEIIVYDIAGKEVIRRSFKEKQSHIDTQNQLKKNNIYVVRIITKEKSYSKKIFIQN